MTWAFETANVSPGSAAMAFDSHEVRDDITRDFQRASEPDQWWVGECMGPTFTYGLTVLANVLSELLLASPSPNRDDMQADLDHLRDILGD